MSSDATLTVSLNDQLSAGLAKIVTNATSMQSAMDNAMGGAGAGTAKVKTGLLEIAGVAGIAGAAILGIGSAAAAGLGVALGKAMEFSKELSNLAAVSGASAAQMVKVDAAAIQFGKDTVFSAQESAAAMSELVKAGLSIPDVLGGATQATVALAAAGDYPLKASAEVASAIKNSFQLAADQMPRLADVVAGAANASAMGVADFGEAIKAVGPTAGSLNLSLEDTGTALGVMAQYGLKGAEAGNSFKRMLINLANPTQEGAGVMKQLGIDVFDAAGKMLPMSKVAEVLRRATAGLSDEARTAALSDIFGTFGLSAATDLAKGGAAAFDKMGEAIGKVSAADVAKEKLNNLAGDLTMFSGSWETALISLGKGLEPVARMVVQGATSMVNALMPVIEAFVAFSAANPAIMFGALAAVLATVLVPALLLVGSAALLAAGPALAALAALGPAVGVAFAGLGGAISLALGPVLPILLAVGAAAAVFGFLVVSNFGSIQAAVGQAWAVLSPVLTGIQTAFGMFTSLLAGGADPFTALSTSFGALALSLQGTPLGPLFDALGLAVTNVLAVVQPFANILMAVLGPGLAYIQAQLALVMPLVSGLATAFGQLLSGDLAGAFATAQAALGTFVSGFAANVGTLLSSVGTAIVAALPGVIESMRGLAVGFFNVIASIPGVIATAWPLVWGALVGFITETVPMILSNLLSWSWSFSEWVVTAIGYLLGSLPGLVMALGGWILTQGPILRAKLIVWANAFAQWAVEAIPGAIAGLVQFIANVISWIIGTGLPMLISAAGRLASGLISGFLNALSGKSGALTQAGVGIPGAVGKGISMPGPWAMAKANAAANIEATGDNMERSLQRQNSRLSAAAGQVGSTVAKAMVPPVAGGGGGGGGGGAAKGAGGGGGGGGGAAAQDPAQAAMQAISGTTQALTSLVDFAEKAFKFRGFPPPEIMDQLFKGLKDILLRAIELSKGMIPEQVELANSVAQLMSGFIGALTGLLDLSDKLARWRPPSAEALTMLMAMARWLIGVAKALTTMATGGAGLEEALKQAAISSKVAESLKAWADFLVALGAATTALAKARWDVPLGPVMSFVTNLAGFVLQITQALMTQLGTKLALILSNAQAVAEMLKPWVDLLKGIAETTQALAKARWDVPTAPVEAFIVGLAAFVLRLTKLLRSQLGYFILVVLEDTRIIADTLKAWMEPLAKVADVTKAISHMRPISMGGLDAFILGLLDMMIRFAALVKGRLGPMILVALEDSKAIAETLSAWMAPLEKVGTVAQSIDVVRGLSERRTDTTFDSLQTFLVGLTSMLGHFVTTARALLGPMILVALEDSKALADTLGAWLAPLEKIGAVAVGIDSIRLLTQRRFDVSMKGLSEFLFGLAGALGAFVDKAQELYGTTLPVVLLASAEVAAAFGPWLDMLGKVGSAADAIDKVRGMAQRRWDTTLTQLFAFLQQIGEGGYGIIKNVQKWPAPSEALAVSQTVAQTFGAWLDMLAKVGAAVAGLNGIGRLDAGVLDRASAFLMDVAVGFAPVVRNVARAADPKTALAESQAVAQTFGVWLDMLAKVGAAAKGIQDAAINLQPGLLAPIGEFLLDVARTFHPTVVAVARAANPAEEQALSSLVAQTWGVWLDMLTKAATLFDKMSGLEVPGAGAFTVLANGVAAVQAEVLRISEEFRSLSETTRTRLVESMAQYVAMVGPAIDLMDKAAGLGAKLAVAVEPQAGSYAKVARIIAGVLGEVQRLAGDLLPSLRSEALRLVADVSDFAKIAGEAVGLFDKAAGLGLKMARAVEPAAGDYGKIEVILRRVFAFVKTLAERTMPDLKGEQAKMVSQLTDWTKITAGAVDLFDKAAGLGAKLRAAVAPSADAYQRVGATIRQVFQQLRSIAQRLMPDSEAEALVMVAAMERFQSIIGPAVDLASKAAGLGQSLNSAVRLQADRLTLVRDAVSQVVGMMTSLALLWQTAGQDAQLVAEQVKTFSGAVSAAVAVVAPVADAIRALSDPLLSALRSTPLAVIQGAIVQLVGLIEGIAEGYRLASGLLDDARVGAITGFSSAVTAAIGAIGATVDVLAKLTENQGKLYGASDAARAAVTAGIRSLVRLMVGIQAGYGGATPEVNAAMSSLAAFAAQVGAVVSPFSGIVDALDKIYNFGFKLDDRTGRMVPVIRRWGTELSAQLVAGITLLVMALKTVLSGPGMAAAIQGAAAVAKELKPVAEAIGAMIDPITRLLENPFTSVKARAGTDSGMRGYAKRLERMGYFLQTGITAMANALVAGLSGISVASVDVSGITGLIQLVDTLVTAVERAMQLGKIDFGKLNDLVKAAGILAQLQPLFGGGGLAFSSDTGTGSPGGGAPSLPPSMGAPGSETGDPDGGSGMTPVAMQKELLATLTAVGQGVRQVGIAVGPIEGAILRLVGRYIPNPDGGSGMTPVGNPETNPWRYAQPPKDTNPWRYAQPPKDTMPWRYGLGGDPSNPLWVAIADMAAKAEGGKPQLPGQPGTTGGGATPSSSRFSDSSSGGGGEAPVYTGPVTIMLANAKLLGDVDAEGLVHFTGTQNIDVNIAGDTIQKTSRSGSFKDGQNRDDRTGPQA